MKNRLLIVLLTVATIVFAMPIAASAATVITELNVEADYAKLGQIVKIDSTIPDDLELNSGETYTGVLKNAPVNCYVRMEGWWIYDPDQTQKQLGQTSTIQPNGWGNTHAGKTGLAYGTGKYVSGYKYAIAFQFIPNSKEYIFNDATTITGVSADRILATMKETNVITVIIDVGTPEDIAAANATTKKTGADTSDSSNIALFSILAILGLVGAGFVYKTREN